MPTFRGVLIEEVEMDTKTKGGIYIPSLVSNNTSLDEKTWRVVKAGKDCQEVKAGDLVYIIVGIRPEAVGDYFQVMEMQIKGYERKQ